MIDSGKFYPAEAKNPEARLRYYAQQFPMVEVDASYYAIPTPATAQAWAARTPADFTFNVKAFRLFTRHQTDPKFLEKDIREALPPSAKKMLYYRDVPTEILDELWRRFKLALLPLARNAKLTAVHFQFAPWVINDRNGIAHVIRSGSQHSLQFQKSECRNRRGILDRSVANHLFDRAHLKGFGHQPLLFRVHVRFLLLELTRQEEVIGLGRVTVSEEQPTCVNHRSSDQPGLFTEFGLRESQRISAVIFPGALRKFSESLADRVSILFHKAYMLLTNSGDNGEISLFDHPIKPVTPVCSNNGVFSNGHPPVLVEGGT